jgi:hypothetical protein
MSTDWTVVASLATAGGTLVLAVATFAATRSANRSARVAEKSLQLQLQPVLMPNRPGDPPEPVTFSDGVLLTVPGGAAVVEEREGNLYLALAVRNVGTGLAVLRSGHVANIDVARMVAGGDTWPPADELFRPLQRHIYIPPGDQGFWQIGVRTPDDPFREPLAAAVGERQSLSVTVGYGDHLGGHPTWTRFAVTPAADGSWITTVNRHAGIVRT